MKNLSKFTFFLFFATLFSLFSFYYIYNVKESEAQSPINCGLLNESCCNLAGSEPNSCKDGVGLKCQNGKCISDGTNANPPERGSVSNNTSGGSDAFPKLRLECTNQRSEEFHSLRPYQAAPCGDAPKAIFCSNKLQFIEDVDVTSVCEDQRQYSTGSFICQNINVHVQKHDLYVTLDNSQFPILGNTEDVVNHVNGEDSIDDATKVNEYVSWYLNGVVDKKENKDSTDDQIINLSGPVRKLLPSVIQDVNRIKTIESAKTIADFTDDETGKEVRDALNHNQIVVDNERLKDWDGDLSFWRKVGNAINPLDAWNKRTPPLPWDDGTAKEGETKIPFKSDVLFKKAYNEWQGKSCAILPFIGLQCLDLGVTNKYADLWRFVPLSNNSDKKGANFLVTVDGPSYDAAQGTTVENAMHSDYSNAPLYFPHTQEVMDLSNELNKTYTPGGYKSEKVSQTTERNNCSALNVRANKGDNIFPGDGVEISVTDAEYDITSAKCVEKQGHYETKIIDGKEVEKYVGASFKCNAEVAIVLQLATKTPFADDIFANTVADSGSTFRRIFPKVGEGAPVSCIADMPTVTSVTYDPAGSQLPKTDIGGGTQDFKVKRYPEDAAGGETPELTFPHIGSVYEYFLKGIQTALRPKGYGEPITDGLLCNNIKCGELPKFPEAVGSCKLGGISSRVGDIPKSLKDIVSAAAETYKVPPNLVLGALYGESVFNRSDKNAKFSNFDWTDENVTAWGSCTPLPNCTGPESSLVHFFDSNWNETAEAIKGDLKKLDPNKNIPDPCNLVDSIYAITWNLRRNAFGAPNFAGKTCFGIKLNSGSATKMNGCDWDDRDIETSIRWWEFGTNYNSTYSCATLENSCALGGSGAANCTSGDKCETISSRYSQPSHNACVFDVAHGN